MSTWGDTLTGPLARDILMDQQHARGGYLAAPGGGGVRSRPVSRTRTLVDPATARCSGRSR